MQQTNEVYIRVSGLGHSQEKNKTRLGRLRTNLKELALPGTNPQQYVGNKANRVGVCVITWRLRDAATAPKNQLPPVLYIDV